MNSPEAMPLSDELAGRRDRLLSILRGTGGCAVAFSRGIDSTVVAKAAQLGRGERSVAVAADSPSVARSEREAARRGAARMGVRHEVVRSEEFSNPDYLRNDGSRCF